MLYFASFTRILFVLKLATEVFEPSNRRNVALRRPTIVSVASDRMHSEHRNHHSRPHSRNRSRAPSSCAGRAVRVPPLISSLFKTDHTKTLFFRRAAHLRWRPRRHWISLLAKKRERSFGASFFLHLSLRIVFWSTRDLRQACSRTRSSILEDSHPIYIHH